jgi:hypothetical protein
MKRGDERKKKAGGILVINFKKPIEKVNSGMFRRAKKL